MADPEIDASEIEVHVREGTVTLTGTVEDRRSKRMAEDAVEDLAGVKDVQNQLQVARGKAGESSTEGAQNGQGTEGKDRNRMATNRG